MRRKRVGMMKRKAERVEEEGGWVSRGRKRKVKGKEQEARIKESPRWNRK